MFFTVYCQFDYIYCLPLKLLFLFLGECRLNEKSPVAWCDRALFVFYYICIYTYEHCSLTTV